MTAQEFGVQLERLKTQWPNSYGEERTKRIWETFKSMPSSQFREVVDAAVDTMRACPLVEDLCRLETECDRRRTQSRTQAAYDSSPVVMLDKAARQNRTADPDFVQACLKQLRMFLSGQLTRRQFTEACDDLDRVADQLNPTGRRRPTTGPTKQYSPYKED